MSLKFLINRVPPSRILEILDFDRIWEYATNAAVHESQIKKNCWTETFQTSPHKSNSDFSNLSFFFVFFLEGSRSDIWTSRPRTLNL
jgi:hypothetical protein